MQVRRIFKEETYLVEDFDSDRFPVHYDKKTFPDGIETIKICYEDDEISGISLHGAGNSMTIRRKDNNKILGLIRDSFVHHL